MESPPRLRFPPSPTGHLHIGNVRTALYNWLLARKGGGRFILRIEDTDLERSTGESERLIIEDLRWLGLDWDEGPEAGGPHAPYRQSERGELYSHFAARLLEGGRAYYCFCSPAELEAERRRALAEKRPPRYSGKCRSVNPREAAGRIASGAEAALRFRVEEGADIAWDDLVHGESRFSRSTIGDFVILRSGGMPAYNFAVVVDDALMQITHVIRGDDHISNTPRQVLLYQALGFAMPRFAHLPMILGPDGSRLSKRHGATSVEEFRQRGYLPEALVNYLALLGWNPGDAREKLGRGELIELFSLERVSKSAAIFSTEKLDWLNGQYMRGLDPARLAESALPFLQRRGYLPGKPTDAVLDWVRMLAVSFAASAGNLEELAAAAEVVFRFDPSTIPADPEAASVIRGEGAESVLEAFLDESSPDESIDEERFAAVAKAVRNKTGLKGRALFHPLRVALTTRSSGLELVQLIPLLERGCALPPLSLPEPVIGVRERVRGTLEHLRSR